LKGENFASFRHLKNRKIRFRREANIPPQPNNFAAYNHNLLGA
jgi:hypothetical protein